MKNITQSLKIVTLAFILSFGFSYAYAWVVPTVTPPGGNASAPINVSTTAQYKGGALGIGGLLRGYGNAIFDGSVGVGTTTPWSLLHVTGAPNASGFAGIIAESSTSTDAPGFCATSAPGSHVYGCMGGVGTVGHFGIPDATVGDYVIASEKNLRFSTGKPVAWTYPQGGPNSSTSKMSILSNGNVGIGTTNPQSKLDVNGTTKTTGLQVTTGAAAGKVLTSDATGNATWQTAAAGGITTITGGACAVGQVVKSISPAGVATCGAPSGSSGWVAFGGTQVLGAPGFAWVNAGTRTPTQTCINAGYANYSGACRSISNTGALTEGALVANKNLGYWAISCQYGGLNAWATPTATMLCIR